MSMPRSVFVLPRKRPDEPEPQIEYNLPVFLTAFIGRDVERTTTRELLLREDVRLLTMTGPPGVGKTRLAARVAADSAGDFAGGVYFAGLAPISDPNLVAPEIARALELRGTPGKPLLERLKHYLRDKQLLLVLDNFEQVVEAALLLPELLQAATGVKVLVTSRVRLRLYGEHEFQVPPMAVPGTEYRVPSNSDPLGILGRYEAVQLFVERAAAIKSDFELTERNAAAVAQICRRLDGMPLAIELAAARVKVLTPQAILPRLQSSLQLLSAGDVDLPARQRTLRGAIAWSFELLDPNEQRLFRWLAVFRGGCTLEAIGTVCSVGNEGGTASSPQSAILSPQSLAALDSVQSLVDKSLLRQDEGVDNQPRFVMLEMIYEFAREQLGASGEEAASRQRHADFYLALAEELEPKTTDVGPTQWRERTAIEHDNMRAALDYFFGNGDIEKGARMSCALARFWFVQGYVREGLERFGQVLAMRDRLSAPLLATALLRAGTMAWRGGEMARARAFLEEAVSVGREISDARLSSDALDTLGVVTVLEGRIEEALALLEEALVLRRAIGEQPRIAQSLNHLGEVARQQGDYERAAELYEESLKNLQQNKDGWGSGLVLHNLGSVAMHSGDHRKAEALYLESLAIMETYENKLGLAQCFDGLAAVAEAAGRPRRAVRLLGATDAALASMGIPLDPADRVDHERTIAAVRARLGDELFAKVWAEGRAMLLQEAVAYAKLPVSNEALPEEAPAPTEGDLGGLTHREREIAALIAQSKSNSEIATELVITKRTVETHIGNILAKLGFTSRGQIAAWAIRKGLAQDS